MLSYMDVIVTYGYPGKHVQRKAGGWIFSVMSIQAVLVGKPRPRLQQCLSLFLMTRILL